MLCSSSQGIVYSIDESTGGLEISHQLILSNKDYPGEPGGVQCMKWTPDGCVIAVAWSGGGLSLWSTFGALLMCSLGSNSLIYKILLLGCLKCCSS